MGQASRRLFAVVPAAGLSRRMGRHKLLMELAGQTVIERLLQVLNHPRVERRVVVVRQADKALQQQIANAVKPQLLRATARPCQSRARHANMTKKESRAAADCICPENDPPDMKASVRHALDWIDANCNPSADDGWLLIPADHAVLSRIRAG